MAALAALVWTSSAVAVPSARIAAVGPAPASAPLHLVLPLRADLAGLRRAALAITTPGSPQYGAYEPLSRLAARFGADLRTRARVLAFLRHAGARDAAIDPTGLFADATLPAARAAQTFATPLAEFRTGVTRFIAPAASAAASAASVRSARIPPGLAGLITGVIGLDTRPIADAGHVARARPGRANAHLAAQPSSARVRSGTPAGCPGGLATGGFTPNQYLAAYGYGGLHTAGVMGQGQRVALIEVDGFKYADLQQFAFCFGLPIPALNTYGVGISRLLDPGGEATLDLEVLDAAAPGLASINVFETEPTAALTLRALTAPLRTRQKPAVISASLGLCEPALSRAVGDNGVYSTEGALEMASASGVTFVASSGDQGSADCSLKGAPVHRLSVNYPSSSWWVTGVGGTNLELSDANAITDELVWNDAAEQPGSAGGGGTSELFNRPNYQRGSTGAKGRAVPDVAMLSDIAPGYAIYCSANDPNCVNDVNHNPWEALGGTSAATPLLAGGFAMIDQQLQAAHRQPLGLVNPLLYSLFRRRTPGVFYDVTRFGNDTGLDFGDHQPLGCCTARTGYDEASGLGSVNLTALAAAAVAQQPRIVSVSISLPGAQRPVRQRAITVRLSCDGPCTAGADALVTIGRDKPFEVPSAVVAFRLAGSRTLALRFTARQLGRLRAALAHHTGVRAQVRGVRLDSSVYSVIADPSGSFAERTAALTLAVRG